MWICINMHKISSFHLFPLQTCMVNFRVQSPNSSHPPILDHAHPKNFQSPFTLHELLPTCKNRLITPAHFWDSFKFSLETRLATPIYYHAHPKNLYQLLTFAYLYQDAKNKAVSSIFSGEKFDLEILQSDWIRVFKSITPEQDFSQI